ncbi:MAG: NADH-quinone oxidoreductase subunit C [Terracidiphilus sp.]
MTTSTLTPLDSVSEKLGTTEPWVEKGGAHWLATGALSVRELAKAMNELHARFVTITAYQLPGEQGFRLEYHWDLDGQLLGFPFQIAGNSIDSIYDLCEAADWIEREIHEGFAIDFLGREYEPLLLRRGDTPGVNLRDAVAAGKEQK